MITIGIIGSRRRDTSKDYSLVRQTFNKVVVNLMIEQYPINLEDVRIVSGGCPKGGDRFAEVIAKNFNIPITIHRPDRSKLEANTRWAFAKICYERNGLIAQDTDILIACAAPDRKGGSEDTIKKYLKMGKDKLILC